MADAQELIAAQSPAAEAGPATLVVEQQKLSSRLQAYIKLLADQQPSRQIEVKVARHRVVEELEPYWPKIPGWETESREMLDYIDEAVKRLPVLGPTSDILVLISMGSSPLVPPALPEPDEAVSVMAFDSLSGTKRQCTIQSQEKPEANDAGA